VTIDREPHTLSPNLHRLRDAESGGIRGTYPLPEAQKDRFMLSPDAVPGSRQRAPARAANARSNSPRKRSPRVGSSRSLTAEDLVTLRRSLEQ